MVLGTLGPQKCSVKPVHGDAATKLLGAIWLRVEGHVPRHSVFPGTFPASRETCRQGIWVDPKSTHNTHSKIAYLAQFALC